jgi:hypothetical protein
MRKTGNNLRLTSRFAVRNTFVLESGEVVDSRPVRHVAGTANAFQANRLFDVISSNANGPRDWVEGHPRATLVVTLPQEEAALCTPKAKNGWLVCF